MRKYFGVAASLAFLAAIFAASVARADTAWRSTLHVTQPTEIPGMTLEPGDYVVKVIDTTRPRKIVQFLSSDETKVFATVLAVPNYRLTPEGDVQFTFYQQGEGAPQAIHTWFYPGNNYGIEFVYPKERATALAAKSGESVMATEHTGEPAPTEEVSVVPAPKATEPTQVAESRPAELPKTASDVPLLAILGGAALAAGGLLRRFAR